MTVNGREPDAKGNVVVDPPDLTELEEKVDGFGDAVNEENQRAVGAEEELGRRIVAEGSRAKSVERGLRDDMSSAQSAIADRYTKRETDEKIAAATPSDYDSVKGRVAAAEAKIPAQASAQNQLADKAFVNSSIATNTAFYISDRGRPFQSLADLENYEGALTNNDYAFVVGQDADGNTTYTRYKWNEATGAWGEEYVLNNSSFTAAQWAAINSGITSGLVAKLGALPDAASLAAALAGKASKADATLTERGPNKDGFRDWNMVVSGGQAPYPYRIAKRGDQWVLQEDLDGEGEWIDTSAGPQGTPTSTLLVYDYNGLTYTATRTALPGYQLGNDTTHILASEAEAEALRTGKLDKSDVVVPSTAADAGKAADAKATGDALAARPTKSQLDEGWWSEWKIMRTLIDVTTDVTSQVGQPQYNSEEGFWDVSAATLQADGIHESPYDPPGAVSLEWSCETDAIYTATRHRVAAPVPTRPEDIGAAPLASPAFTGTPTAPTPESGDNSTKVATTAFVHGALDMLTVIDDQLVPLDGPGSSAVSAFGNSYLSGHFSDWSSVGVGSLAYTARNSYKQDWAYPTELFTDRFVFAVKAPTTGGYGAFRRSLSFPFSGVYRVSVDYTPIKQGDTPLQLSVMIGLSCNGGAPVWNNVGQCEYGRLHSAYALVSAKAGAGFIDVMAKESGARNGFAFSRLKVELVDKAGVEVSEIADSLTSDGDSPVKSSGIWSALWGALAALPTGFTSLYDWCVAQLAGKFASTSAAPAFDPTQLYKFGDLVTKDGILYQCEDASVVPGSGWNLESWRARTVFDIAAQKAANPTAGNLAALDANGNLKDSGKKPADFVNLVQDQNGNKTAATLGTRRAATIVNGEQVNLPVGSNSLTVGEDNVAASPDAVATGRETIAGGYASHAEGNNTKATGNLSHAEGTDTVASGLVSHAEGNYTTAAGTGSHSEGMFAKASGVAAHAEGSTLDRLADLLQAAGASAEIVALFRQAATDAAGSFSHTEGLVSATSEMGSHAQGFRASDGGNQFSFVWQGYSGQVPTAAQMQALLDDPTSQDAQIALGCLVTALNARAAYTSKGPGTFCVNPAPQGGSTDPKTGFFVGDEPLAKVLRYSFHTASQDTPSGSWNITEVPSGVDSSDIVIEWDIGYNDWCIINSPTGDFDTIGRHDENDKSPISYNGYVANWVEAQRIYGLADRAINTATLGPSVTAADVTLPTATAGYARDFFIDLTIEATTAPTLTFIDPATGTTANVAFGADSLADIAPGYNLVLFTELPNNRWLVSVRHEEAS